MIVSAEIPDELIEELSMGADRVTRRYSDGRSEALDTARSILWNALRVACGREPVEPPPKPEKLQPPQEALL